MEHRSKNSIRMEVARSHGHRPSGLREAPPGGATTGATRAIGKSQKTLQGDFGELELETPRDI